MKELAQIRVANLAKLGVGPKELTERVGSSVSYWSDLLRGKKSFGEKAARKIEQALDLAPWSLDAQGEDPAGQDHSPQQSKLDFPDKPIPDVDSAQAGGSVNIHTLDIYPVLKIIPWEELMGKLPSVFRLKVADNALAPRLSVGDFAVLATGVAPSPGDGILVRDSLGQHHLRIYRQVRPGEWVAAVTNTAYADLGAETYGLSVVAVITGEQRDGRWSGI